MQSEVMEPAAETREDEVLMTCYQQGQVSAFDTLYHRHKAPLYRYFLRQCSDKTLAEDLYQDVWSRVIKASDRYQPSAKFTTWLYRIAYNRMVDHYRSLKIVNNNTDLDDADALENDDTPNNHPEKQTEQAQQTQRLKACLRLLPPRQLEVFMLKEEGGFSAASIAEIVDVSMEAVKSRLRYTYQKLRACISDKDQESGNE